jgi:hypothetical protein
MHHVFFFINTTDRRLLSGHFVPEDDLSWGNFVPNDVLSRERLVREDVLSWGHSVPEHVFSQKCSVPGRFVSGSFFSVRFCIRTFCQGISYSILIWLVPQGSCWFTLWMKEPIYREAARGQMFNHTPRTHGRLLQGLLPLEDKSG